MPDVSTDMGAGSIAQRLAFGVLIVAAFGQEAAGRQAGGTASAGAAPSRGAGGQDVASSQKNAPGPSFEAVKEGLKKPPGTLVISSQVPVATFRAKAETTYEAEFKSRLRPILELSPEDKKLARQAASGAGLDPLIAWRAYQKLARRYENRRARREVAEVMEQLRRAATVRPASGDKQPEQQP